MRDGKMIQVTLLSALLLAMSFPAVSQAALDAVSGLPDPAVDAVAAGGDPARVATSLANGFPLWYQDSSGRKLELCLEQRVEKTAASGGGLFFPCLTAEPVITNPISFPTNFGAEAFYWTAAAITTFTSSQDGLPAGGGDALLVVGEEASFLNSIPNDGEQIVFGRTRLRINVPVAGTYRVTYPFGSRDFVVPVVSAGREINQTLDIGILAARDFLASLSDGTFPPAPPAPADPSVNAEIVNLDGRSIGPFLEGNPVARVFDTQGNQYLSDPGTELIPIEIPIEGGVNGVNYFSVELLESPPGSGAIPPGFLLDAVGGDNTVRVDRFQVVGKVFNDGLNVAPQAHDDAAGTARGQAIVIDVAANDTDVPAIDLGDPFNPSNPANTNVHGLHPHALGIVDGTEILRTAPFITAKGATVQRTTTLTTGKASYIYTPLDSAAAVGDDFFTYVIQDKGGLISAPATVTVTVEDLAIERAEYRPRSGRWQILGTSSDALANSVTVYGSPRATLSGDAEVPPVITEAAGSAALLVNEDSIDLQIRIDPMPASVITAIRIHVDDPAANDPFIFTPFSTIQGAFTGTLTRTLTSLNLAARPTAGISGMEDAARAIRAGHTYIKVYTVANPGGEIRGRIVRPIVGSAPVAADGSWVFSGKSTASPGAFRYLEATSANGVLSPRIPLQIR